MEKRYLEELREGASAVGVSLSPGQLAAFGVYADELVRWNARVNLTAITEPGEIVEKHFVDSLAVAPHLPSGLLLDLGTGAGFPGLPVRLVREDIEALLVDSIAKKVSFLKALIPTLGLARAAARAVRAGGRPDDEGLPRAQIVVARAVTELPAWLALAAPYRAEYGVVAALLGRDAPADVALRAEATRHDLTLVKVVRYRLPRSGAERTLAVFGGGPGRST